jgi:hypothetical protein
MKPGERVEVAVWLSGTETEQQRSEWEMYCADSLRQAEEANNVNIGEIAWTVKRPGEEMVPPVPDHISGPDVRLLVGEATVLCERAAIVPATGFIHDLTAKDLARLRQITRQMHFNAYPKVPLLTDTECDEIIERIGPNVALKNLRGAVDSGTVH